jgi:site-specific DNA recombinase
MSERPQAFVLLRVSSSGQTRRDGAEDGYSIEMQRSACRGKAKELGAEIAGEWTAPAESASRGFYKTLTELLAALKARGDIAYVIVYKLDRFARDELTNFAAYAQLKQAGAELVSATESIDGSPSGMLLHGILASINAFYSGDLAQKITDGRTTKAKLGGTPGRAPIGYLNVKHWEGKNDIRTVEIDQERTPHIQWAFQAYATGEWPLRKLTDELYRRGLRGKPTSKRPAGRVRLSTINAMLRNPYYVGTIRFRGAEYEGNHQKLIPRELFDRVQEVLDGHDRAAEKHWRHEHHLKGTVHCGVCGRRLVFTKCRGRRGTLYDYFVCGARHDGTGCSLPYLSADLVEHFVAEHYEKQVKLDAERVSDLEPKLIERFGYLTAYREREAERCRRIVDDILGQRRQLVADHLERPKAIPLDVLEAQQADLGKALAAAKQALAKVEAEIGQAEKGLVLARRLLHDSAGAYRAVDPKTRRRWNQTFFTKLFLATEGVVGAELTDEFGALLAEDLAKKLETLPARPGPHWARGSNVAQLVELAGLEPATSWVRSRTAFAPVRGGFWLDRARFGSRATTLATAR